MKYFGTDGIRGNADKVLPTSFVFKLANALGKEINDTQKPKNVVIGKDTRESGERIEAALIDGLTKAGVSVTLLNVTSTPHVSFELAESEGKYAYGIMISASHNPFEDNGIKVFSTNGVKISPETEKYLEDVIANFTEFDHEVEGDVFNADSCRDSYIAFIDSLCVANEKLNITFDGANGSTYKLASDIFKNKVGSFHMIGDQPNGININENIGSTHPETLAKAVIENNSTIGISFDGDGDRIILVDENGEIVDGDGIIYVLANYFAKHNRLNDNKIVTTVMSNLGLLNALKNNNIAYEITPVGDKYVAHAMIEKDINIGGEQSGHIIIKEFSTTGDGLLVAAILLTIIAEEKKTLKQLLSGFDKLPQHLLNVKVADKKLVMQSTELADVIAKKEETLNGDGRILVRASGTEEVVRVMAEAKTQHLAESLVNEIAEYIGKM